MVLFVQSAIKPIWGVSCLHYKLNFEVAQIPFCIVSNRKSLFHIVKLDDFKTNRKPLFKIIFEWAPPNQIKKKIDYKNYNYYYFVKRSDKKVHHIYSMISPKNKIMVELIRWSLLQIINLQLRSNNHLILHSSSCMKDDKAIIFSGNCGEGKSTLLKRLIKKNNFAPIHEDVNILVIDKNEIFVYPHLDIWKRHLNKNKQCKLYSIYFIKKAKKTLMKKLDKGKIYSFLASNLCILRNPPIRKDEKNLKKFANNIKAYTLQHKKNEDIFRYLKVNPDKIEITPYIKYYYYSKKYWLIDFNKFKLYKINKKIFQFLRNKKTNFVDKEVIDSLEKLKKLDIIK